MGLARVTATAFALLLCAWFALGVRQAHDTVRAAAIVSSNRSLSAAEGARADSLLSAAGALNPDSQVDLLRGQVAMLRHDLPGAARVFETVVRREPQNVLAWLWLAKTAYGKPVLVQYLDRIKRLDPKG